MASLVRGEILCASRAAAQGLGVREWVVAVVRSLRRRGARGIAHKQRVARSHL